MRFKALATSWEKELCSAIWEEMEHQIHRRRSAKKEKQRAYTQRRPDGRIKQGTHLRYPFHYL